MRDSLHSGTGPRVVSATWAAIVAGAIALALRHPEWPIAYSSKEALALVVPIAGTIVALALPAAQLASSVMERFLTSAEKLIKTGRPIAGVVNYLSDLARSGKRDMAAMRRVVELALLSLLVGLVGVVGLAGQLQLLPVLAFGDLVTGLSIALLVASVMWFLPVVRSSFDFSKADRLIDLLRRAPPVPASGAAEAAGAKPAQPEAPSQAPAADAPT